MNDNDLALECGQTSKQMEQIRQDIANFSLQ